MVALSKPVMSIVEPVEVTPPRGGLEVKKELCTAWYGALFKYKQCWFHFFAPA